MFTSVWWCKVPSDFKDYNCYILFKLACDLSFDFIDNDLSTWIFWHWCITTLKDMYESCTNEFETESNLQWSKILICVCTADYCDHLLLFIITQDFIKYIVYIPFLWYHILCLILSFPFFVWTICTRSVLVLWLW